MSATLKHIKINNINVPIVFEEDKHLPILNLQLVFKNSGYIQDKNKNGLASLSAKLLNEGTKELGSTKFAQKLEDSAISLHSNIGFETFVIELSSIKEVNDKGLKLLKQLLNDPNYDKDVLEKLKTISTGGLKRKEHDFDYIASTNLKKILFKNTPLESPASGTIKSISNIKLSDIENFLNKTIDLNNLIIVAGGDINFKDLSKKLNSLLKDIKADNSNKFQEVKVSEKVQTKIIKKDTQQAYIYFGSPFYTNVSSNDNYKAKVASFILGGSGFGSRLMEEIRVKRGLAYSAYGYVSINKSHTYFTGYLQTKLESADEAKDLVIQIVDNFVKEGVTKEELDSAKNFILGSEPLRTETLSQRLHRAFTLYYRGLDFNYTEKELEKIENLTLEELNSYIQSHKEIKKLSFSIVRK
ncbi:peptidase M16 [Halarcobacter mediterraneus]|uniref:Peptidase M16 n=1 Tax=Halarcobacter mediterraneus TaxID=2023153 RepID=A0A4Q1AX39_9BACT|nr:pitrilysin family protein [Halarcobacter mediterraneus]RXK14308.1 peptidase M16 [Halarcobacter mediterraneus]